MFQIRRKSFFNYDLGLSTPVSNDSKAQNDSQDILTKKHLNKPKTRPKNNTEGYSGVEILETECTAPKTSLRSSVLKGMHNESSLSPKRKKINNIICMCHDKENKSILMGNINQKSCTVLDKENLEQVLPSSNKVTEAKVNLFNCTYCDYQTNLMGKLKLHLKVHDKDKQYRCSQCDYSTNIKKLFQKHQKSHSRTTVKNSKSNLATNWKNKMPSSQSAHSKVKIDNKIPKIKNNNKNLKRHLESHKKSFKCPECDKSYNYVASLNRHKISHSKLSSNQSKMSDQFFNCSKCNYSTKKFDHFVRHLKNIHNVLSHKLKCDYCTFETYQKYVLEKHTQKHFSSVIIKCPECDYVTNDKHRLQLHSMCHSTINLKCTKCNYTTHRKDSFKCHLKKHLNV